VIYNLKTHTHTRKSELNIMKAKTRNSSFEIESNFEAKSFINEQSIHVKINPTPLESTLS
jgi:hypothetical protein